jgi:hypothetical protein
VLRLSVSIILLALSVSCLIPMAPWELDLKGEQRDKMAELVATRNIIVFKYASNCIALLCILTNRWQPVPYLKGKG